MNQINDQSDSTLFPTNADSFTTDTFVVNTGSITTASNAKAFSVHTDAVTIDASSQKTGKLSYSLTNDYMFRAILQENQYVLKGLIAALLHLEESQIRSIQILNPIRLGESISDREFCLDVHILLNDSTVINLEMQVINHGNWTERSLSYLCRSFDNLPKGVDYIHVKPTVHIGFLNFALPGLEPEFYGSYYMMNEKTHQIYSDKLRLSVVNLKHIDLATEEDKRYHIDEWAALFKAGTWEELEALAGKNDYFKEAVMSYKVLSEDEQIRYQCEAREDYYHTHANLWAQLKELRELKKYKEESQKRQYEQEHLLVQKEQRIVRQEHLLTDQAQRISNQEQMIKTQLASLSEKDAEIAALKQALAEQADKGGKASK